MEEWKSIIGFEGLYEVSNLGRVRSLWDGRHQTHRTKILKPIKMNSGYLCVGLHKNGEEKKFLVHRLVAEAFIPNPLNKPQVNHKTEDKTQNSVDCLEWCTNEYNQNYGTRNERVSKARINNSKISKPVLQLTKNGELVAEYPSTREAERQTVIDPSSISKCCNGKQNSAGGYVWKYKLSK